MNLILVANETPDQQTLMHWRTKGSKNGVRRYQNLDGSLTPEGYQHYKEMYGWGDGGKLRPALDPDEDSDKQKRRPVGKGAIITDDEYNEILDLDKQDRQELLDEINKDLSEAKSQLERDHVIMSYRPIEIGMLKSRATLERNAGHPDLEQEYLRKAKSLDDDAQKARKKLDKEDRLAARDEKERKRDEEAEARAEERRKIYEADQKKMVDDIMARVAAKQEAARKREADAEAEKKSREEEARSARSLTDDELNKAIGRLQKEKQYSDLLNERANREKGPIAAMASKLFKEAAENMARKALNAIADEATKKLVKKLSGDDGSNNKNDNNQSNKNDNQPNNKPQGNQPTGGPGQKFSKGEKTRIRSMASSGNSVADIAKALGVTEDRVKDYMAAAGITIT